jgi:hypothetical protein
MSMPYQTKATTIPVNIGKEVREFPAHYGSSGSIGDPFGLDSGGMRLEPDHQEGWEFQETITGEWHGFRVPVR